MKIESTLRLFIFSLTLSSTCLLLGCENNDLSQLKSKLQKIKLESAKHKDENFINEFQMPKPVVYQTDITRSDAGNSKNSANPLRNFSLNTLKFVGVTENTDQLSAYISTPDNMVYAVKVGDFIGDHDGKVSKINADSLAAFDPSTQKTVILKLKE